MEGFASLFKRASWAILASVCLTACSQEVVSLSAGTDSSGKVHEESAQPASGYTHSADFSGSTQHASSAAASSLTAAVMNVAGFRFLPGQWYPIGASSGELVAVVSGDIDGDMRDDIIMASRFNGTTDTGKPTRFLVIRQSGSGTLLPIVEIPYPANYRFTSELRLAIGDLDNDSRNDAVMGSSSGLLVLSYQPGSGFVMSETMGAGQCLHIVLLKINADDYLDAACLNGSNLSFLLGDGERKFTYHDSVQLFGDGWFDLKAADIDGDGFKDLLVLRDFDATELLVFPNDGAGGFGFPVSHPMPPNIDGPPYGLDISSWGMQTGDFNSDGLVDLVVSTTNRIPSLIHVLYGNPGADGPLFLNRELEMPGLASAFAVSDFDKDGDRDIFVRFHGSPITHAMLLEQDMGRLVAREPVSSAPSMSPYFSNPTAVGDINRDGCPDVVSVDGFNLWVNLGEGCLRRDTGGPGSRRRQ